MSTAENDARNRGKQQQKVQTIAKTESIISSEVFYNRRNEIYEYLKLFGYKPDNFRQFSIFSFIDNYYETERCRSFDHMVILQ